MEIFGMDRLPPFSTSECSPTSPYRSGFQEGVFSFHPLPQQTSSFVGRHNDLFSGLHRKSVGKCRWMYEENAVTRRIRPVKIAEAGDDGIDWM